MDFDFEEGSRDQSVLVNGEYYWIKVRKDRAIDFDATEGWEIAQYSGGEGWSRIGMADDMPHDFVEEVGDHIFWPGDED